MSIYAYRGRDAEGRRRKGWTEAESPKAARAALAAQGILTESVEEASTAARLSPADRARFYNETGVLLSAGFTLEQALGLLSAEGDAAEASPFLLSVRDLIRNGASLSRAMVAANPGLPPFERTALETAEESGLQGTMLVSLSQFIESEQVVSDRIKAALAYPAAVLALALGLLSLMVFVILPKATSLFAQFGDSVPAGARLLSTWGPRVILFLLVAVIAGIVGVLHLRSRARADEDTAIRISRATLRLPLLRHLLPLLWSQRFSGTMSLLVQAGVAPQSTLAAAGAATGSAWVASLARYAAEEVRNGRPLSAALASIPPVAPHLAEWVRIGESSGSLAKMLDQASARCRQAYEASLTRLLGFLEPALILAVGIVVLVVALAVLRPMLDLARSAAI